MVHALQPDQERVKSLLSDTIKLLCKNGLSYKTEFCLNGVIGITLDRSDVFLVDIRETVKLDATDEEESSSEVTEYGEISQTVSNKKRKRRRKDRSSKPADSPSVLGVIEIPDNQFQELATIKTEQTDSSFGFEPFQDFKTNPLNAATGFSSGSLGNMSSSQSYPPHPMPLPVPFMQHSLNQQHQSLPQGLQEHSQDKSKGVYTCNICQQTMSTANGLRYHMNRHKGIFPYYCPYCNKGQPGTTDLKNHLASVHTNGRAGYLCIYCQHMATSSVALKAHLDICTVQGNVPTNAGGQAARTCEANDSEDIQPSGG